MVAVGRSASVPAIDAERSGVTAIAGSQGETVPVVGDPVDRHLEALAGVPEVAPPPLRRRPCGQDKQPVPFADERDRHLDTGAGLPAGEPQLAESVAEQAV